MRRNGFSVVEVIIVLVIVGIIVALGVVGYDRWKQSAKSNPQDTSQQSSAGAPEIKQTSDLDKATTALDRADISDTDTTDLDAQANSF